MAAPIHKHAVERNTMPVDFYNHPKYHEMKCLGLTNDAQMRLALLTYLDLVEMKGWWNVSVRSGEAVGLGALLVGHSNRRSAEEVILPVSGNVASTVAHMHSLTQAGKKVVPDAKGILLAIVNSDSSISYFRLSDGLVPPGAPEEIESRLAREKRLALRKKQRFTMFKREAQLQEKQAAQNKSQEIQMSSSAKNDEKAPQADNAALHEHQANLQSESYVLKKDSDKKRNLEECDQSNKRMKGEVSNDCDTDLIGTESKSTDNYKSAKMKKGFFSISEFTSRNAISSNTNVQGQANMQKAACNMDTSADIANRTNRSDVDAKTEVDLEQNDLSREEQREEHYRNNENLQYPEDIDEIMSDDDEFADEL